MEEVKNEKPSKNFKIKQSLFRDKRKNKPKKVEDDESEIKRLKNLIETNQIPESDKLKKFLDFPISKKTVWGLKDAGFVKPTEIQRESIGLALRGLDILGAAKTGSGKSLAFIIPVLEKLYMNLWTKMDGLGALIITPTRELAYQIFETLKKVGKNHDFSAGLIIGGKDLKFERKRMDQISIIICTPGRLLQHMDENPNFNYTNLQILVLDEADRCLDMGFEKDMNAIIENLPADRQTLLFSATQTKSVKDLARLSLKSPVYVSVHENAEHSTPETLQQSYVVCPLESKLDMLWSFLKHHKHKKILVFLSSCKQVRFVHLLFCRMRPGMSVLSLYGSLHQLKRMSVYDEFCRKQSAVLFATDIAARGLDFPAVDWVVQLDCPEDATTYIHRAGRTARYNSGGEALLTLLPSEEEGMLLKLSEKKIPITKIEVNSKKLVSVQRKFESLLARDINLKECAQRAFKSYLKSVFLMKNKTVFDVCKLDLEAFSRSLGLAVSPRVRFLQKKALPKSKSILEEDDELNLDKLEAHSDSDISAKEEEKEIDTGKKVILKELMKRNASKTYDFSLPDGYDDSDSNAEDLFKSQKLKEISGDSEEDEAFIVEKQLSVGSSDKPKTKKPKSKAAMAKKLLKKNILSNKKVLFDEAGSAVPDLRKERQSELAKSYEREDVSGIDVERAKAILKEEDQFDKQIFRERIRAKHREERLKKRSERKGFHNKEEDQEDFKEGSTLPMDKEESDSDEGPDLSWLPDPDRIYGPVKKTLGGQSPGDGSGGSDSEEESEEEEFGSESEEKEGNDGVFNKPRKRKIEVHFESSESEEEEEFVTPPTKLSKKNKIRKKASSKDKLDKDLMEELALQLLSK